MFFRSHYLACLLRRSHHKFFIKRLDSMDIDHLSADAVIPKCRFLDRVRVYGTVKNVFTLTKFSGVDPSTYQVNGLEPGAQGSRSYYPSTRQFIAGVQVDF